MSPDHPQQPPDAQPGPAPTPDTAAVIARPPAVYFWAILLGATLQYLWPLRLAPWPWLTYTGWAFMAAAVSLFAWALMQFAKAATPVPTNRPTRALIGTGPYRFTRNPIYLSFTLLQLGLALATHAGWLLATLAPAVLLIRFGVIAREERYLTGKFGDSYLEYMAAVRRWF